MLVWARCKRRWTTWTRWLARIVSGPGCALPWPLPTCWMTASTRPSPTGSSAGLKARRIGDEEAALNSAATLGTVLVFVGRMDEGWRLLEDAIARAVGAQQEVEAARGYRLIGSAASELVEYDRGQRWLADGLRYAEQAELWNHRHFMASNLAHVQWATGQWAAATQTAQQALADGRGGITTRITAQYVLGFLAMGRGDWTTAETLLREALAQAEEMAELNRLSPPLWGLAEAALCRGDYGTAVTLCERGYQASVGVTGAAYLFPYLLTGARAYLAHGDIAAAENWSDRVGAVLTARAIPGTLPAINHGRGLVLLARGELSAARQELESASEGWRARRRFWEGMWGRLDLAHAAVKARRRGEAAVLSAEARTIAAAAGATTVVDAADQLTASSGRAWQAEPWHPLSEREFEVAQLVAARPHQPADRRTPCARAQDNLGTHHPHPHQTGRRAPRRDRSVVHHRPAGRPRWLNRPGVPELILWEWSWRLPEMAIAAGRAELASLTCARASGRGCFGSARRALVEALGFLQVRHVSDAVVPGSAGGRAGGEHVFGHCGQDH